MPWGKLDCSVSLEWSLSFCLTNTRLLLLIPTPVEGGRKGSLDKGSTSYMGWAILPRVCLSSLTMGMESSQLHCRDKEAGFMGSTGLHMWKSLAAGFSGILCLKLLDCCSFDCIRSLGAKQAGAGSSGFWLRDSKA